MLRSISSNWRRLAPGRILDKLSAACFDRMHGTDTATFSELRTLHIDSENKRFGERYQPSPVHSLRRLLRRLDIAHADFSFIDFGSGKGRTLLIAGKFPFKRVLGVEFSEELHRKAEQNILCYGRGLAGRVRSVYADATQFDLPSGDLVLYFFNPFTKLVLDKVLANLMASIAAQPRRVILVYLYLPDERWLASLTGFADRKLSGKYRVLEYLPCEQSAPRPSMQT